MAGPFQPYEPRQRLLLPPSLQEWLSEDHLAYFVSDAVDQLDLSSIVDKYRGGGSGSASYHPAMMLKLLIYAYCIGVFSSRRIAKAVDENIAFRVLAAGHQPSHRTICRFRRDHIAEFQDLFVQLVQIAASAGLVKMGQISIDGTKIKANASKHKAMTYSRMQEEEERLRREIETLANAANNTDELEDKQFGEHFDGTEIPAELARRESRLQAIRKAKEQLEKRKRDEAAQQVAEEAARDTSQKRPKRKTGGGKKKTGTPDPKDQANFTDPDSRIMKSGNGYEQAFNAQLAIDDEDQLVVAAEVTQQPTDVQQLLTVLDTATSNAGSKPRSLLADAGYLSEDNLQGLEERGVTGYVAIGHKNKDRKISDECPATQRMQSRLRTKRGAKAYAKRKHKVEAPIGWIKRCIGFVAFSMRGTANAQGEFALVCLALNLRRLNNRMAWCG